MSYPNIPFRDRLVEHKNWSVHNNIKKLYLNSEIADVHFVFGNERIPAHKNMLALGSLVFKIMFFGSLPEKGDVKIVDASSEVFKEFLQFFYLDTVHLKIKNLVDLMRLCRKYEMDMGLKICEDEFIKSISIDSACWSYSMAFSLERENLVTLCEQFIEDNASAVLTSDEFLACEPELMAEIFRLVSDACSAGEFVDACMKWATSECEENEFEENSKNLRDQLEHLFDQIPFDKLTIEQLNKFIGKYKGFFTLEELEIVTENVLTNELQRKKWEKWQTYTIFRRLPVVDDFRNKYFEIKNQQSYATYMSITNKKLLLTDIYITLFRTNQCTEKIRGKFWWSKSNAKGVREYTSKETRFIIPIAADEFRFTLSHPVTINADDNYALAMMITSNCCGNCMFSVAHHKQIQLSDQVQLKFDCFDNNQFIDFISNITFKIPEDDSFDVNFANFSRGQLKGQLNRLIPKIAFPQLRVIP